MKLNFQECMGILLLFTSFELCNSSRISYDLRNATRTVPEHLHHTIPCPRRWFINPDNRKCVRYVRSPRPWFESKSYCVTHYGGELGVPLTVKELGFYRNLCRDIHGCWLGGRGSNTGLLLNYSIPVLPLNCTVEQCIRRYSIDSCMVVLNRGRLSITADACNKSHPFTCMIHSGKKHIRPRHYGIYLIVLTSSSGLIILITAVIVGWLLLYKRNDETGRNPDESDHETQETAPSVYTKEEIRSFRRNYRMDNHDHDRITGDSKTGVTYIGLLPDGSKVAVKRLSRSIFQTKNEFFSEVSTVSKLYHPNLAPIRGCCYNDGRKYVVYEYAGNGSLDAWLHHMPSNGRVLDWTSRLKIATTLARGIEFLHDRVKPRIIHQHVRSSSVLLDEEFNARLIGTGLSKFIMPETVGFAGGNFGYLAPEFVYGNEVTTKCDVYSYGVLLLEMVSGRKPVQATGGSVGCQSVFEWATPLVQSQCYSEILDPLLSSSSSSTSYFPDNQTIHKVVNLVYACTQPIPSMRPKISHALHQLQLLLQ